MKYSNKSIIYHIPQFIKSCSEKGFSLNTLENYSRYLKKFSDWLKKTNREKILPHQLKSEDITKYRLYLSRSSTNPKTGKSLQKSTQNYYLIALRALLSYFSDKNIVSLAHTKISLPKLIKKECDNKLIEEDLEKILSLPNIKGEIGLRDKAILETLAKSGLKVRKLANLNRDLKNDNLSKDSLFWIEKYLKVRKDKHAPLFINYKSPKKLSNRLTPRSIERIVNKYGELVNLQFSLTPEILRWSSFKIILNKDRELKPLNKVYKHKIKKINQYDPETFFLNSISSSANNKWNLIEKLIFDESEWIKKNLSFLNKNYLKVNNILSSFLPCENCLIKKIATLIISGEVSLNKLYLKDFCSIEENLDNKIYHGKEWHRKMMYCTSNYFKKKGYSILIEPDLNYGRADLGIKKNNASPIYYIEIGTVSLSKIWYNLKIMKNAKFILIPHEKYILEFKT